MDKTFHKIETRIFNFHFFTKLTFMLVCSLIGITTTPTTTKSLTGNYRPLTNGIHSFVKYNVSFVFRLHCKTHLLLLVGYGLVRFKGDLRDKVRSTV